jgi:hypothetical protein
MSRVFLFLIIILTFSCSEQEKYWIGNWGFVDEKLPENTNYVEIYLGDTSYIYQNELGIVWEHGYQVSNDSLYRLDGDDKELVGKMELISDSIMILHHPSGDLKFHKIIADKDYRLHNIDETLTRAFLERFQNRADRFRAEEKKRNKRAPTTE